MHMVETSERLCGTISLVLRCSQAFTDLTDLTFSLHVNIGQTGSLTLHRKVVPAVSCRQSRILQAASALRSHKTGGRSSACRISFDRCAGPKRSIGDPCGCGQDTVRL